MMMMMTVKVVMVGLDGSHAGVSVTFVRFSNMRIRGTVRLSLCDLT